MIPTIIAFAFIVLAGLGQIFGFITLGDQIIITLLALIYQHLFLSNY